MTKNIASTEVEAFLAHYGVLGMHWGKRKAKSEKKSPSKRERLATAFDLPGHRRVVTSAQKNKDRKQILGAMGAATIIAGAAWVATQRWNAGSDARLFAKHAPELRRRVMGITEIDL